MDYSDPATEMEWLDEQESRALEYLAGEGAAAPEELEIEWCLAPYVSVWTFPGEGEQKTWVICGDLPTDYLRDAAVKDARSAVCAFGQRWAEVASYLLKGSQHPRISIGRSSDPKTLKELGDLLQRRARLLMKWTDDPSVWEEPA